MQVVRQRPLPEDASHRRSQGKLRLAACTFFRLAARIRQGTAHRFLARRLIGRWHLARRFAFVSLQVFQLPFQLFDLVLELLRLAAELHAPQFGNLQLEMLDLAGARVQLFRQPRQLCIAFLQQALADQQQCLQGIDIVGQVGKVEPGPSLREGADVYKADDGCQVRYCFRSAVCPEYEVLLYDKPAYQNKVSPAVHAGDRHVATAALVLHTLADKVCIVSANLPHLAVKDMAAIGIDVVSPGDFIDKLNAAAAVQVEGALLKTIDDLSAPRITWEYLLKLLMTHGANDTAQYYASKWGVPIPR